MEQNINIDDILNKESPKQVADTKKEQTQSLQEKETPQTPPVVRILRTYQGDIAEAVKSQKTSVLDVAVKADERRRERKKDTPVEPKKNIIVIVISFILIATSIGGIYFLYTTTKKEPASVAEIVVPTLIYTNYQTEIFISNPDRKKTLSAVAQKKEETSIPLGSVTQIYFTKGTHENKSLIDTYDILTASLETKIPTSFLRFLGPNFMFGLHSSPYGNSPFLILKISSYEYAFANMLNWEKDIEDDLVEIIAQEAPKTETREIFSDLIIENKDVRAIIDTQGKIVIAYCFPDKETLVIFNNATSLKEILSRMQTSALRKQ